MADGWPFFQATLLDNMEMVLAKSDLAIARRYLSLVEDASLGSHYFGLIESGWKTTHDAVLAITGQSRLLEKNPHAGCLDPPAAALHRAAEPVAGGAAAASPRR